MSDRFKSFSNEEVAVLGVGLAFAGTLGEMTEEAGPLLKEVNEELTRPERQKDYASNSRYSRG
jgi:hypothetical protein